MSAGGPDLDRVMTAEAFVAWVTPTVQYEAAFTEENNEDRTLGDYLADLIAVLQRIADTSDVMHDDTGLCCTDTDPEHVHDDDECCECGSPRHCCGACPVFYGGGG